MPMTAFKENALYRALRLHDGVRTFVKNMAGNKWFSGVEAVGTPDIVKAKILHGGENLYDHQCLAVGGRHLEDGCALFHGTCLEKDILHGRICVKVASLDLDFFDKSKNVIATKGQEDASADHSCPALGGKDGKELEAGRVLANCDLHEEETVYLVLHLGCVL